MVKVICHKAHRRHRRMVQCYSTGDGNVSFHKAHWCHLANTIELVHPSANSSPQSKWQMDRFSRFSLRHKVPILYNGRPYPSELPFPMGDLNLPCNTWCYRPMQAHNPNGTSIGSAVFAEMTVKCLYNSWSPSVIRQTTYSTMVCLFPPQNCPFPCWHLDLM